MKVKIYVEGGGEGHALRTACRHGFSTFLERARLGGRMPRIVACGSRQDAFDSFCTALRRPQPGELPLLLVDSETSIAPANGPWAHLRAGDGWARPAEARDEQVYLMVQCMETWFLADADAVAAYFGQGFRRNSLPRRHDLEAIDKHEVLDALARASLHATPKGKYQKERHAFELLSAIDPVLVRQKCPQAERLLSNLQSW